MTKTIGILGGMGPEATAYFFSLIIRHTRAAKDQEHIPILIYNNPRIPPRTDALLGKGPSPLRMLKEGVRVLEDAGADFVVMPCITAHAYFLRMAEATRIPLLNILDETLAFARKKIPRLKRVGLIASTGTVKSGLFRETFAKVGIEIIAPTIPEQKKVMEAIFGPKGIKSGLTPAYPKRLILNIAGKLIQRGAQAIIAGCTEVPLVLKDEDISVPLIEPLRIAAEASIVRAGYRLRDTKKIPKLPIETEVVDLCVIASPRRGRGNPTLSSRVQRGISKG